MCNEVLTHDKLVDVGSCATDEVSLVCSEELIYVFLLYFLTNSVDKASLCVLFLPSLLVFLRVVPLAPLTRVVFSASSIGASSS